MTILNYHHLRYFWAVAREGSIAAAAHTVHAAPPTISTQVKELEEALGEHLFQRQGRRLALTEMGRVVFRYADEIFALGRELQDAVGGRPSGRPVRLLVGVADQVPKLIAYRILEPARRLPDPVTIVCLEDKTERLIPELAGHGLDLVITDAPLAAGTSVKAFNHPLGECGVSFFAAPALARRLRRRFPQSLDGQPFLLSTPASMLRRALDAWFEEEGVRPVVAGEFEDSALLKVFGQRGAGAFAGPSAIATEIRRQHQVGLVGHTDRIRERFYAISVERKLRHPAVTAIVEAARGGLFA